MSPLPLLWPDLNIHSVAPDKTWSNKKAIIYTSNQHGENTVREPVTDNTFMTWKLIVSKDKDKFLNKDKTLTKRINLSFMSYPILLGGGD